MRKRYRDFNTYLRDRFGCRVQKIVVDAGSSCPNRDGTIATGGCIYCNERGSGSGAFGRGISIRRQLLGAKQALRKRYGAEKFLAYFQSFSNTYAPLGVLAEKYAEALAVEDVVGLCIGTRPDCVDSEILDYLAELNRHRLVWIEYGLQSANDATLQRINRGHDYRCFERAVTASKKRGLPVCAHIIIGLPGENRNHVRQTAQKLASLQIDGIKLHLLYVIRGTKLEKDYQNGGYRCLTPNTYAEYVCDVLERLPPETVVQRLTSDPHPEELVAPSWALDKQATIQRIEAALVRRNTRQGRLLCGAGSQPGRKQPNRT